MKNPTEQEMVAAYAREFPMAYVGAHERDFLAFLHLSRSRGVGWGFMRQAVGMHWKEADPIGYIDDQRVIELHTYKRAMAAPLPEPRCERCDHQRTVHAGDSGPCDASMCSCLEFQGT